MIENDFYKSIIEHDLNPFVLFDSDGKLTDFNKEAEFLFNFVTPKELYDLAILYASQSMGFNQKFISLKYGKFLYYAILVGYIDDENIGLRLYKEVNTKDEIKMNQNMELTNIYNLIELSKSTTLIQSDVKIEEVYDVSIPEIKLNINEFILILNECFSMFEDEKNMVLKVNLKIGEYEIIEDVKYQIISIEFKINKDIELNDNLDKKLSKSIINYYINKNILFLELPMIL